VEFFIKRGKIAIFTYKEEMMMKRLYRSQTDRKIAGIFGGLGELYGTDPNVLRLAAVLLFLVTGFIPLLATYFVAWFILPDEKEVVGENTVADSKVSASEKQEGVRSQAKKPVKSRSGKKKPSTRKSKATA
jgi:phage shock protein C